MKYLAQIVTIVVLAIGVAKGQTPPAPPAVSPVKMTGIKIETASLPGSSLQWTKIIIGFTSTEKWADGIVFNVSAVLGEQLRSEDVV